MGYSLLPRCFMPDFTWPHHISPTVASEIPETTRATHPKLPFGLILKWSDGTRLEEVLTTQVARRAGFPVPKVICYGDHPDTPHAPVSILMTRIPGDELGRVYKTLSGTERDSIQLQLKGYLEAIRRWKSPWGENRICSSAGTAIRSVRVPNHLVGPFESEQEFNDYLRSTAWSGGFPSETEYNDALDHARKMDSMPHRIVFTHGDLKHHNILVHNGQITGFLDWESAGWCPEYWDFTTALRFIPKDHWWYNFVIGLGAGPYMAELDCERALTSLTVDSYCCTGSAVLKLQKWPHEDGKKHLCSLYASQTLSDQRKRSLSCHYHNPCISSPLLITIADRRAEGHRASKDGFTSTSCFRPALSEAPFILLPTIYRQLALRYPAKVTIRMALDYRLIPIDYRGAHPNMRAAAARPANEGVASDWATRDGDIFFRDTHHKLQNECLEWFPLQAAAHSPESRYSYWDKDRQLGAMRYLLEKGADPYALYRAPLERPNVYRYPGETFDEKLEPLKKEFVDISPALRPHFSMYGICSVIHSIFENGGQVLPFFDEEFNLDIERRDPQGRTVLHSVCRSILGADAILGDVYRELEAEKRDPLAASVYRPSLFHAFRLRNADMLAVDNKGKHILHHLFESPADPGLHEDPKIDDALLYTLTHLPQLVNQPDYHGNYPIHAALQSLRHVPYYFKNRLRRVEQLLAAGADPLACDGRGNTALHYLAATGFDDIAPKEPVRALFRKFAELGVDVNARNKVKRTAIEIFLDDENSGRARNNDGQPSTKSFYGTFRHDAYAWVNLLDLFDEANTNWTESNANGQTLLHLVALQPTKAAVEHAEYLLAKGVDASAKDRDEKVAADIAEQYGRDEMLKLLRPL
ncbi:predicted protein [Uncinocarpus reesii 1704]|uniref:Aminoglycoside phosphotransferase domain-containing protein n=1 Tax=Uncinocarpus reesii (strain UAMH 1704) TaxID=336963 RepID=C4JH24_UNCRE|nr:uncharacterized protein UREG_01275 [Uncinocarpus reesii 1704]EEP76426.1 predicted protein [Uncinocarpus reesii 1704]